jgi:hypothetical protein
MLASPDRSSPFSLRARPRIAVFASVVAVTCVLNLHWSCRNAHAQAADGTPAAAGDSGTSDAERRLQSLDRTERSLEMKKDKIQRGGITPGEKRKLKTLDAKLRNIERKVDNAKIKSGEDPRQVKQERIREEKRERAEDRRAARGKPVGVTPVVNRPMAVVKPVTSSAGSALAPMRAAVPTINNLGACANCNKAKTPGVR